MLLNVLLLCALLLSGLLNVFLFGRVEECYRQLCETRLDPFGLRSFPERAADGALAKTRPRVVLFGDGRVARWPQPAGLTGYEIINRGAAAQTTARALGRFEHHVGHLEPDIVLLHLGLDDLMTLPLFPDRRDRIIEDCKENIDRLVEQSRKLGARVVLATITPPGNVPVSKRPFWSPEVGKAIVEVNEYLSGRQGDGVALLDAFGALEEDGRMNETYAYDFLQLRDEGYQVLNRLLEEILQRTRS